MMNICLDPLSVRAGRLISVEHHRFRDDLMFQTEKHKWIEQPHAPLEQGVYRPCSMR
ncbi:MAG: hypothetical protein KBI48_01455 [Deltaproteobacteria bacterium]|nr:hypothetical protein [Deltaproteobacteria bacterium]